MRIRLATLSLTILSSTFILGGCGYTMMEPSNQDITFLSSEVQDAKCLVSVDKHRYHVQPPQTVSIKKSAEDMKVTCQAQGNQDVELIVPAKFEKHAVWGKPSGKAWDYDSQSSYYYPDVVAIDFARVEVSPNALSEGYNDAVQSMPLDLEEEFSAPQPAVTNDHDDVEAVLMHKSDNIETPSVAAQDEEHMAMETEKGDLQSVLENLRVTPTETLKSEEGVPAKIESADSEPVELFPGQ